MPFKKLVPFRGDSYLRVMKMSIPFAQDCFARFNDLCFNGVLPVLPMVLTSATSFLGKLRYSKVGRRLTGTRNVDFQIRLSSEFDLTAEEWEDVIIHEMIHLYIASGNMKDSSSHGRIFRTMMNEINSKYGRHIVVNHRIKPSDDSPRLTRSRFHFCLDISGRREGSDGLFGDDGAANPFRSAELLCFEVHPVVCERRCLFQPLPSFAFATNL